jgi:hypothetical protein
MMERPEEFNEILHTWFSSKNIWCFKRELSKKKLNLLQWKLKLLSL